MSQDGRLTHKDQHVAAWPLTSEVSDLMRSASAGVATCGYEELERWSSDLGQVHTFGIEGTGSYGAGLARFLRRSLGIVLEVNRPDRSVRYRKGKSDPTDAETGSARVLAGVADATAHQARAK